MQWQAKAGVTPLLPVVEFKWSNLCPRTVPLQLKRKSLKKSLVAFADPNPFHQPHVITHKGLRTLTKYISLDDRVSPNALPAMITATSS